MKPKPIVEFPEPRSLVWQEPETFPEALRLHMERHGDTWWQLHRAVVGPGEATDRKTLRIWLSGTRTPRSVESLEILARIERRYRLPAGYFKSKLPNKSQPLSGHRPAGIARAERRRLAWHLPDDFDKRSPMEQEEILDWVRTVVMAGSTDYRRFQAAAMKHRFAVRFPDLLPDGPQSARRARRHDRDVDDEDGGEESESEVLTSTVDAPPRLHREMAELLRFKTATLTAAGYQRVGVWGQETAS